MIHKLSAAKAETLKNTEHIVCSINSRCSLHLQEKQLPSRRPETNIPLQEDLSLPRPSSLQSNQTSNSKFISPQKIHEVLILGEDIMYVL